MMGRRLWRFVLKLQFHFSNYVSLLFPVGEQGGFSGQVHFCGLTLRSPAPGTESAVLVFKVNVLSLELHLLKLRRRECVAGWGGMVDGRIAFFPEEININLRWLRESKG